MRRASEDSVDPRRRGLDPPLLFSVAGAFVVACFFAFDSPLVRNGIYTALPLASAIAIAVGIRRHRPEPRTPWLLLLWACIFFVIGNACYLYYEAIVEVTPPYPSVADPLFLAFMILTALALALMIRARSAHNHGLLIDSLIAGVGFGLLTWVILIEPYFDLGDQGPLANIFGISYPLTYVFGTTVAARLLVGPPPKPNPLPLMTWCLVTLFLAFFGYSYLSLSGGYSTGHPIDAPILLSVVGFGASALMPGMAALLAEREAPRTGIPTTTAFVYLTSLLMGPIGLAVGTGVGDESEKGILVAGTGLVGLLILARLSGLISNVEQAATEKVAASEALASRERRYREFVEGLPCVVYRALPGAQGGWLFVSPQIEALTGYEPESFMGHSTLWIELVHPDDRDAVLEAERGSLSDRTEFTAQYRMVHRDGSIRWVRDRGRWAIDDGMPIVDGVLLDITERIGQEQERHVLEGRLRQSERLEIVGRLAGGIAHDFNNTIAVIRSYGEFILDSFEEGDPRREDAEEVLRASLQASELTRQLLLFARAEEPSLAPLDINDTIRGVGGMFARTIREDIDLKLELDPDLSASLADKVQFEQVLSNLIVNARDAMPEGGSLTISTSMKTLQDADSGALDLRPGRYVVVEVADTGTGIPPDILEHIFEPFFTTKGRAEGTGLGLATAYSVVTNVGGAMLVESEPGSGTSFTIYLPATDAPVPRTTTHLQQSQPHAESLRILLVEDEPGVRIAVTRLLERQGHEVTPATRPEEALAAITDETFDVLVTDVVMPGMSGPELARQANLPTVFMSGYAEGMLEPSELETASHAFVGKPFMATDLAAAIASVVEGN